MPYEWISTAPGSQRLHLWPYRSLPKRGFVTVIAATAGMLALPLVSVLGSPVLWGILPFGLAAIWGLWWALERSYRDGEVLEELSLTPGTISLTRHGPRGRRQTWQANPHWVQVNLHPEGGPVPHYLTLRGAGREVELGAFLSEEERIALMRELTAAIARQR
jgi:uncharacterized membrane protein